MAMANVIDQDQQWLLNCLSATLDPNHEVRSFAEASLNQASLQPGFGSALSKVAANRELPLGLRQLAAVLLKQFVKKHWQEGEDSFEHPAVSSDEKAVIRRLLLMSLDDPQRKICTAISMAVASIAVYDWPEEWPDLLPFLLKLISDQTNMNGAQLAGTSCCFQRRHPWSNPPPAAIELSKTRSVITVVISIILILFVV